MGLFTTKASVENGERKTRAELDQFFIEHPGLEAEFVTFVESHTLAAAQEFLATDGRYNLALSTQTISVWATKKRKEAAEIKFRSWLAELGENAQRARDITGALLAESSGRSDGAAPAEEKLAEANVAILNAALLQALQTGAVPDIKLYAKLSAQIGETRAKQRAASAAMLNAETQSKRFYFDAAKLALEHAAELHEINLSAGSQRDKIERAVARLFGARPNDLEPDPATSGSATEGGLTPP